MKARETSRGEAATGCRTSSAAAATIDPAFQNPETCLCIRHHGVTIASTLMAANDRSLKENPVKTRDDAAKEA
ncbi:hypothetical protein ACQ1Z4_14445, partial [Enterococcus faecalis]|uniref:hypothetical protein n=1 Tax=Enterococcus faecalis TaxID=1351 RepID=UPI003D6ADB0E